MRGRKPIPNAIKRATGDGIHDSGKRVIGNEPQPQAGAPDCPKELTGEVRKAYKMFAADVNEMKVGSKVDRAALVILAQTWATMMAAYADVEANGRVVEYSNGSPGVNQNWKIYCQAQQIVKAMLSEFGLTPVSRSRLTVPEKPEESDDLVMMLQRDVA